MLQEILDKYLEIFPEERDKLQALLAQLETGESLRDRKNFYGHIAGDGIVLSPDGRKVLLIYHKFFQMWQQPGGHWDAADADPLAVAKREVIEETGVQKFKLIQWLPGEPHVPLAIDVDHVPENPAKQEDAHLHYTFAYLFQAEQTTLKHREEELGVGDAKWLALAAASRLPSSHFPGIIVKLKQFHLA